MFKAREATVRQIFDNGEYDQFVIPAYQRSYVWGIDELENFWNDFVTRSEGQSQLHLVGSIIISKSKDDAKKYGVVDGQQRLITSSLVLAALRDVWGTRFGFADQDYYNLERFIVRNDRTKGTLMKIRVADSIRDVFESIIVAKQMPTSPKGADEKAVLTAYRFFLNRAETMIDRPKLTDDNKKNMLWTCLENMFNSNAVLVTLDDEDDAYEVFEGFNARGVELSIADLFKNLIIQKVGGTEAEKEVALSKWNEINTIVRELNIPKFNINTYLRYFWIRNHQYIGEKELYRRIKKETKDYGKLLNQLYAAALDIKVLFSDNVFEIKDLIGGEPKRSASVNDSLKALRVMNTQSYMVWLMSLTDSTARVNISAKWIATAMRHVEVFSFRYFGVSKLPANRVEKFYARLSRELFAAVDQNDLGKIETVVLNTFIKDINEDKLLPAKEQFLLDFEAISLQSNNKPFIRYVLSILEDEAGTKEKRIDQQAVNIEHILPQKPSKEWAISAAELKESVNRLGNLTILLEKINATMSNKPIRPKMELLRGSQLHLNHDIIQQVEDSEYVWGPTEIGTRQVSLAQKAEKAWNF
jgi:uncharacterized protein with ParB-like and HNH nuclease domain